MANVKNATFQRAPVAKMTSADLSDYCGRIVQKNAAGTVALATSGGGGEDLYGIILDCNSGTSGPATIATIGCGFIVDCLASATIGEGDFSTTNSNGTATSTTSSGDRIVGIADTPGTAGYLFKVLMVGVEKV